MNTSLTGQNTINAVVGKLKANRFNSVYSSVFLHIRHSTCKQENFVNNITSMHKSQTTPPSLRLLEHIVQQSGNNNVFNFNVLVVSINQSRLRFIFLKFF